MNDVRYPRFIFAVIGCALAFFSCTNDVEPEIQLPPTPLFHTRPSWAMVRSGYVRVLESFDENAAIVGHLRGGDVVRIEQRHGTIVRDDRDFWYRIDGEGGSGWVKGSEIELFASRALAQNAAEAYHE
ncbi:MAG: hypothetical protein EA426_13540 [Spirochaetaceae bacterium]|nr:MAG: hypothetical protein EA426_13540 [Spirochaetaceae bacterium]